MENQRSVNVINEVFGAFEESLEQQPVLYSREIGVVKSLGEGIARVSGLPNVQSEEIISFGKGKLGLIYNLDPDEAGVILLDEEDDIGAGDEVFRTGKLLSVPVGEELLGRVVDALGRPLDEKGPINSDKNYLVERPAPAISKRASVREPLQTGIISIDALIPIGRGQRELILGDRQTGKTAIAVDTILN
ncbi:MAG TPA: F0F1 ATP synthase subunit alpha, partial [Balneolaceae bacterium]|nr:F0F1 ATP synthase subunit alpha [Balneolaceae bacterium]